MARVLQNVEGEKYREWYDAPMAEFSPKSSESGGSIAPSLAPPAMPYQIPGFYPMPWIQPYPQPGQYPMPFYGPYPGYPIPPPPLHPPSSDTNSFPAGGLPWHGVIYNVCSMTSFYSVVMSIKPFAGLYSIWPICTRTMFLGTWSGPSVVSISLCSLGTIGVYSTRPWCLDCSVCT